MAYAKLFIIVGTVLALVLAADGQIRVQTKCGLPSFYDRLPADAKKKLDSIWANYADGQECKEQLKQQRAIVKSLSNATKEKLFKETTPFNRGPPICGLPHFINELPLETQKELRSIWTDYKDGIECEDMQNATKNLIDALPSDIRQKLEASGKRALAAAKSAPAFLKFVDRQTRQKFHEIFVSKSLDKTARRAALRKLAESALTGEQLRLFYKYEAKRDVRGRNRIDAAKTKEAPLGVPTTKDKKIKEQLSTVANNSTVEKGRNQGRKNSTLSNETKITSKDGFVDGRGNGSQRRRDPPPCGIPPFLNKLPIDAQEKVRTIWANYVQGNNCKTERKATRDLLKTLPREVRQSLRSKKRQIRRV